MVIPDDVAIKVDAVAKTFRLPHEKTTSIKGALISGWRKSRSYEKQIALEDLSFDIKKGDFFGIVGRNGSGKSTLLKLIAGIYVPTKGAIHVNGSLTPFIELGVGFNPELTGRENVFLNGALLGFNRKQITAMYPDIVAFAELERFMDQKLKNYSSGMQVRLAFSIAIRANSDILLLDEVLAVGDAAFQKKCLDYFRVLKDNRQTVVLVTHDMTTVEKYCNKAVLIHDSKLLDMGDPQTIAAEYQQINLLSQKQSEEVFKSQGAKITDVTINGEKNLIVKNNEPLTLKITYKTQRDVTVAGALSIAMADGTFLTHTNRREDPSLKITPKGKTETLTCTIASKQFLSGTYRVDVALYDDDLYLDRQTNAAQFTVSEKPSKNNGGLFKLAADWQSKHS